MCTKWELNPWPSDLIWIKSTNQHTTVLPHTEPCHTLSPMRKFECCFPVVNLPQARAVSFSQSGAIWRPEIPKTQKHLISAWMEWAGPPPPPPFFQSVLERHFDPYTRGVTSIGGRGPYQMLRKKEEEKCGKRVFKSWVGADRADHEKGVKIVKNWENGYPNSHDQSSSRGIIPPPPSPGPLQQYRALHNARSARQ